MKLGLGILNTLAEMICGDYPYDYFPYDYNKDIQRIIYIGDFLYSIAQGGIKASTINTVQEAKYIELED